MQCANGVLRLHGSGQSPEFLEFLPFSICPTSFKLNGTSYLYKPSLYCAATAANLRREGSSKFINLVLQWNITCSNRRQLTPNDLLPLLRRFLPFLAQISRIKWSDAKQSVACGSRWDTNEKTRMLSFLIKTPEGADVVSKDNLHARRATHGEQ